MRPTVSLTLIFLCSAVSSAQPIPQSPAEAAESRMVSELLASQDPSKIAWGAYLAGSYQLPAFSGELFQLATAGNFSVRTPAIDSLIRLKVEIPEDVLTRMAEQRLDEVLIVIARRPDPYSRLIDQLLSRKLEDHDWIALNSILASKPPAGFAALLLREWTIRLTVRVYDRNPGFGSGVGPSGGGAIGCGAGFARWGFPPIEAYFIVENPQPGDVILSNGPHPVGYRKQTDPSRFFPHINRDAYREDYLLYLARMVLAHASWRPDRDNEAIDWEGEDSYRTATAGILRKVSTLVAELKRQLVAQRTLSASEAEQTNPALDVQVVDARQRPVPPLPEVRWTLTPE